MALMSPPMSSCSSIAASSTSSSSRVLCRRPAAASGSGSSSRRGSVALRASADNSSVPAPASSAGPIVLTWPQDNETARDVFAFSGSLPERLNGRMAMLGFAGIAVTELTSKVPAAEQLAGDVIGVALLSLTFTLASIVPKFNTGRSLQELHAKATGDNLKGEGVAQALVLFDTNTELWTGRVAMLGLTGLFAVEAITGKVFF